MKKILSILIVIGILVPQYAYSQNYKWTVADKNVTAAIDYSAKVGDYFLNLKVNIFRKNFLKYRFCCIALTE